MQLALLLCFIDDWIDSTAAAALRSVIAFENEKRHLIAGCPGWLCLLW